jgi:predicted Zn-dependent protease
MIIRKSLKYRTTGIFKTLLLAAVVSLPIAMLPACAGHFDKSTGERIELDKSEQSAARDSDQYLSTRNERKIGLDIAAKLLGVMPLVADAELQIYVNQVGFWVAQHSSRPDIDWNFAVLDNDSVNAFAAPGGIVFVTRGLFMHIRNEAELAAVLGHEIAHITHRHHLNALRKSQTSQEVVDWFAWAISAEDSEIYKQVSSSMTEILLNGLDQDLEKEADRVGVVLAARAGYDPFSLLSVLTTLSYAKPDEVTMEMFTATHPNSESRINSLDVAIGDRFDSLADEPVVENRFNLIKGRLAQL